MAWWPVPWWPEPWWPEPWWPTTGAPPPATIDAAKFVQRRSIKPSIPSPSDPAFNNAVKEILEVISGQRPGVPKLTQLQSTATTDEVIDKINQILKRLQ